MITRFFASMLLMAASSLVVASDYTNRTDVDAFVTKMVTQYGFREEAVREVMTEAMYSQPIIDLMTRPAEKKPWIAYRKIFVTPARMKDGAEFIRQNIETLRRAESEFGVPKEIITAIIGVETNYGRNMGGFRVIDALATLGFDYPKRSKFFLSQLEDFFILACEEKVRPFESADACKRTVEGTALGESVEIGDLVGSYAGAMGYGQFIPTSYRRFAIDYDGDGARDIWNNVDDAIGSVAAYFKEHGWQTGQPALLEVTVLSNVEEIDALANQTYEPSKRISEWKSMGLDVSFQSEDMLASVFRYEGADQTRYYLGFENFYVITRYNISRLYAKVVLEVATGILAEA